MLVHVLGGPKWSFTVHGPDEFDKAPLLGLVEKIRRCSFVAVISSYGRSQLYRLIDQAYWPKVEVIHCGLEPAFFSEIADATPVPTRLVCIGRLCEQKGQLLLIEAARRLAGQGIAFNLVLVGDGEMRGELKHSSRPMNYKRKYASQDGSAATMSARNYLQRVPWCFQASPRAYPWLSWRPWLFGVRLSAHTLQVSRNW